MALCKMVLSNVSKFISHKIAAVVRRNPLLIAPIELRFVPERGLRKMYAIHMRIMKKRRKLAGPERLIRRNEWTRWNYKAELYAFGKRLNEEITEDTLRTAFTQKSYIDQEESKRRELGVSFQDVPILLIDNTPLMTLGIQIMSEFIKTFVRHCYKALPEEGVSVVHDYLMSDEVLSHVSMNIGTKDLILCADFPAEKKTLADVLKAIVGAIAKDNDRERAEMFVLDFVLTQLVGKDIFDIWEIPAPNALLNTILKREGRQPAEPRLVFESGCNTIEAIFMVALYSDKEFLGQGPGETTAIAVEMASYDALRRFFQVKLDCQPLPFGLKGRKTLLDIDSEAHQLHSRIANSCEAKMISK